MLEPGDSLDVWIVDRALGHGGMGSVYRCHNRNAPRILAAVKVLELPTRRHPDTTARFIREAEILFGLNHPNIVKVRNVRTDHEPPYLEMEFVEGESIEDALQRGPIPKDKAVDVIRQCASAIHYLHGRGVRHRDIKPANFLLRRDGRVKLVDFGLALEQDVSRITQAGIAFGTVSYAPPEWANPETLDPVRWDLYALGIVMYEILTGKVAFPVSGQGSARQQAMQVVLSKQGHAPLDPGDAFPDDLRELIADLTRSDADERLSDSAEVLRRLGVRAPPSSFESLSEEDQPSVITTVPTPGVPMPRKRAPAQETFKLDEPEPPTSSMPRSAPLVAGAALSVAGIGMGIAAIGLLGVVAWVATSGSSRRDVEIRVSGITADTPHEIRIDGRPADRAAGLSHRFDAVPVGDATVRWVVGEGCTVAACEADACSSTCGHGTRPAQVEDGEGVAMVVVDVPAPTPRSVRLPLPELPDGVPAVVRVDGEEAGLSTGGVKTGPLAPGRYVAALSLGDCAADAAPCGDECPADCIVVGTEVVVPWSGNPDAPAWPDDLRARWEEAHRPAEDPAPKPAAPKPAAPAPSGSGPSGKLVTQAELATWLEGPGGIYKPGAPKDIKNGHLIGWNGTTPPNPTAPVVGISYSAAKAYCAQRGGMPTTEEGVKATAQIEWRDRGDGNAAVVVQGESTGDNDSGKGSFMGIASFRCRR